MLRFPFSQRSYATILMVSSFIAAPLPCPAGMFNRGLPVPQWGLDAAKTHVPEDAKDAPAVILFDEYVESVDGQGRAVEREREAIRILKPQGRGNTCEVSYDVDQKINYFRVWTIAADEKTYQAQAADFTESGDTSIPIMLSTRKSRMVHPPAVDVDATVICESEEVMEPFSREKVWEIQNGIPVVFEALEVDLSQGRMEFQSWHNHAPIGPVELSPNHWRWEIRNMPALNLRDVPSHPSLAALAGRMSVRWGDTTAIGVEDEWRSLGEWVTQLEANRPDPSPEITAKVRELTADTPDFYTKLSRITESIQKDIRYFIVERGIGGLQANPAADIYRNRYGDCKDKVTLLISMLRVADIPSFYVPVDDRRGVVDPQAPSLIGNHMIIAIELPSELEDKRLKAIVKTKNGKRYLIFDPTDERTPVGNLNSYLQGSYGILCAGSASQVIALPVLGPDSNGTERKGTFALDPDGTLKGYFDTAHSGPEGADLRTFLKYTDEKERHDYWETLVARDLPGVVLSSFQVVQPSALDQPLEFHFNVNVSQYAHSAGTLLLVRPRVMGTYTLAFDDKLRSVPVDLGATGRWHDSFDISLPTGYVVDETPDPVDIDLDFASYHSSITSKANTLHYEREYIVREVEIPASRAADFRKLESSILSDERGTAVLVKH
jgi:Domain of Unknown Function with PDB structure (DUF3857)/Transglutaminase-like superfamily